MYKFIIYRSNFYNYYTFEGQILTFVEIKGLNIYNLKFESVMEITLSLGIIFVIFKYFEIYIKKNEFKKLLNLGKS